MLQRYHLLRCAAENPALQTLLRESCRRDIGFWFRWFAWTFDPRCEQPIRAFLPHPFQWTLISRLCAAIDQGEDLLIEKSRDMGVSWTVLLVFQYYWLFRPGAHFLLGSRKEDLVDRKGDLATLFEKLRFNLSWTPRWLAPQGFFARLHDHQLRLLNPENGNLIAGESSNPHFARGGRYRAILMDEFPVWPMDDSAFAAAGQSSPCRIVVGTPFGKNNRFAQLRFEGQIASLRLHWRQYPGKDDAWYARQQRRMSADELARELDIQYQLSSRDRVFTGFSEHHRAELQPLAGRKIVRSWDFGYHCPACLLIQVDDRERLLVLREVVGDRELLSGFASRVQAVCQESFPDFEFEDVCDPAGAQRSDKSALTSIEILNTLGIYPFHDRSRILDGVELIRLKLAEVADGLPALRVDDSCRHLLEAFESGYRYAANAPEQIVEEHPYEDVMDCLRYAVVHKVGLRPKQLKRPSRPAPYQPRSRYTRY
jgi:hypothetical protein